MIKNNNFITNIFLRWELPLRSSQSYWNDVIESIESKVTKVRPSSLILYPKLYPTLQRKSSISANVNTFKGDHNPAYPNIQIKQLISEPIVKVSPPSPSRHENRKFICSNTYDMEHISYLKSRDVSNFKLNFPPHFINSNEDCRTDKIINDDDNVKHELIKIDNKSTKICSEMDKFSLNKITHLSKISKYVNEFLSTTRVKVKVSPSIVIQNAVSPVQTSLDVRPKHGSYLIIEKPLATADYHSQSLNAVSSDVIGNFEKNNIESLQKKVGFQDIENDDETVEHQKILRPRAPSLGVASAVPSFGKIVSSLESSDSIEISYSNSTTSNFNESLDLPLTSKDFLKVPQVKMTKASDEFLTMQKNLLKVPEVKPPATSFYPRSKQYKSEIKLAPVQSFRSKELRKSKTSLHWPRKSIVHVLKALKLMKHREKIKNKIVYENNLFVGSASPLKVVSQAETTSSSSVERDISDCPEYFTAINQDDESLTSSSVSTCTYKSVRERMIKKNSIQQEKINLSLFDYKSASARGRTTTDPQNSIINEYDNDMSPMITKNKSALILNKIPLIGGLFPRKHRDKCLACLHMSMQQEPSKDFAKYLIHDNITVISSSTDDNSLIGKLNAFLKNKMTINTSAVFNYELASDLEYSEVHSELFDDNLIDENIMPVSVMNSTTYIPEMNTTSRVFTSAHSSEPKQDHGTDKKSIVSSKSFVSTLSLASERSKTTSDQDDSDQAIDEVGGMEDGVVESKSKFLAPCHAPLNLRPSLEPLKLLRNKTARSIQSRMASLEKSTDTGSDEESDGDEIPITVAKFQEDKIKESRLPKSAAKAFTNDYDDNYEKINLLKFNDECLMFDKSSIKISSIESPTLDEIFAKLNITRDKIDHDPSKSFRPCSPILSEAEIIEISKKSLSENKNVIQTLSILANEYSKRLSKKLLQKTCDPNAHKIQKITKRLLMLLVDSKLYLHPEIISPDLAFSSKQKPPINSHQLRRVLPVKSYNLIAPLLGLPQWNPKHWSAVKDARRVRSTTQKVTTQVSGCNDVQFTSKRGSSFEHDLIVSSVLKLNYRNYIK